MREKLSVFNKGGGWNTLTHTFFWAFFKEAGPLYSTKNADFTTGKELQYKVDFFAKTENPENPDVQAQKTKFETTFS